MRRLSFVIAVVAVVVMMAAFANPAVQLGKISLCRFVRTPFFFDLAHHEQKTDQNFHVFIGCVVSSGSTTTQSA